MRSLPSPRPFFVVLTLALGLAGCAGGGGGNSGPSPRRGTADHIIATELANLTQLDAFAAIQRLRPAWLRARGSTTAEVMLDGNKQPGGLESLKSMRTTDIQEMRFLSGPDATTRFGTGFDGGVIMVTSKR